MADGLHGGHTGPPHAPGRTGTGGRGRRAVLWVAMALLAVGVGVCLWQLASIWGGYRQAEAEYARLRPAFAAVNAQAPGAAGSNGDAPTLAEVMAMNEDCVGWVEIPGTRLSYPVVQGADNQRYLNTTFLGTANSAGAIFMDARNQADFSSPHTIIYGHNMKNGAMFGSLPAFTDPAHLAAHPHIVLRDGHHTYTYQIYAVRVADMHDEAYRLDFDGPAQLAAFAARWGPAPAEVTQLLTLSTCTNASNEERLLLHAYLAKVMPD